jgi:hypothetical protein
VSPGGLTKPEAVPYRLLTCGGGLRKWRGWLIRSDNCRAFWIADNGSGANQNWEGSTGEALYDWSMEDSGTARYFGDCVWIAHECIVAAVGQQCPLSN